LIDKKEKEYITFIEEMRNKMFKSYEKEGINSEELLKLSQELDQLIYKYQLKMKK